MRIQIDGTNTLNKGAELMLYAVLEAIERKHPKAKVVFNSASAFTGTIHTNLNFIGRFPLQFWKYPKSVLSRLGVSQVPEIFTVHHPSKVDLVLDAGGFQFSDQWQRDETYLNRLENYYKTLSSSGVKIILLSQAFGPFETPSGKRCASILNQYADVLIAREEKSHQYLLRAGVNEQKVWLYPDFTALVSGIVPTEYQRLKDFVCLVPNRKMLTHTSASESDYLNLMLTTIQNVKESGKSVFLLNHEGKGDLTLCEQINKRIDSPVPIVSGLNAKEVKGVIGQSYMVVSSRFHGVASALNQSVPCLATSWSHKYSLLFNDFDQHDTVLKVDESSDRIAEKVKYFLDKTNNEHVRGDLENINIVVKEKVKAMWDRVWQFGS